jgi:outer membrane biosynthesis protein TonB
MGLWEFLRQWRGSRAVSGIAASLFIHALVVAAVLWGAKLPLTPQWRAKPGDALIVELPNPEEAKASPGTPQAPAGPVTPDAPPIAVKSPPSPPPAPPAQREARPAPRQVVASAPRPAEPAKPAPRASEPPREVPRPPEQPADSGVEKAPSAEAPASASTTPAPSEPTTPKVERVPPGPRVEPGNTQVAGLPPGAPSRPPVPDMRSALRRGGGGRGEGRGGILGDPIPLDSSDARFSDFLGQVKRQIEAKLTYPCIKHPGTFTCEPKDTEVIVHFGILKNGRLQYVDLWVASPWSDYDVTSMTAIKLAQPFPPVPAAIMASLPPGSTGMPITGRFTYRVTYSTLIR